ncbi:hypothetical protein L0Y69_00295, partial [bacterium]|nr:hypothetical protein [bacterium]
KPDGIFLSSRSAYRRARGQKIVRKISVGRSDRRECRGTTLSFLVLLLEKGSSMVQQMHHIEIFNQFAIIYIINQQNYARKI